MLKRYSNIGKISKKHPIIDLKKSTLAQEGCSVPKVGDPTSDEGGEKVKTISEHVPKHLKPLNEDQFGHYLAGFIEGNAYLSPQPLSYLCPQTLLSRGKGSINKLDKGAKKKSELFFKAYPLWGGEEQNLVIVFNSLDASLSYYIKKRVGFGSVKKVKNKNALFLIISAKKGLEKVISLINGKLITFGLPFYAERPFGDNLPLPFWVLPSSALSICEAETRVGFNQKVGQRTETTQKEDPKKLREEIKLKNHWLAGFADANATFQIKIYQSNHSMGLPTGGHIYPFVPHSLGQGENYLKINDKGVKKKSDAFFFNTCNKSLSFDEDQAPRVEVKLNFRIVYKNYNVLLLIKEILGGNILYKKSLDTYYYESTTLGSAKKVIDYLDKYHLLSSKQVNYLKWRKAYLILQNKDHLTKNGLDKLIKLKNTMNRLNDTTI